MSTDEKAKSCKGCIHINCRCSDRQQKNYECYNDGLSPAQKHVEELLKRLKEEHYENSPLHYQYPSKFIKLCPTCQIIARAEEMEL